MEEINKLKTRAEVESYRKQMNEACDKRLSFIDTCIEASNLGESGFYTIKENIENLSHLLIDNKKGSSLLKRYTKAIKESKSLSSLYMISENIRKATSETDVDFFINELTSSKWDFDSNHINEDMSKIGQILSEAYILLGDEAKKYVSKSNEKLDEAVMYIASNDKSKKNITSYGNAVKVIKEHVSAKPYVEDVKNSSDTLIGKFQEKFGGKLGDEENTVVSDMASGKEPSEIFDSYKEKCTKKIQDGIDSSDDEEDVEKLKNLQEQLQNKKFSSETFATDMASLLEIYNVLNS